MVSLNTVDAEEKENQKILEIQDKTRQKYKTYYFIYDWGIG